MEHADALERIEIAAVEPDGLDRLMAGDTPDAAAVAGHLAGCPACVAEMARIRRTSALVREAVRSLPDPALRERTLAFVREVGRDRSAEAAGAGRTPAELVSLPPVAAPGVVSLVPPPVSLAAARSRRWSRVLAGLAAAVVIAGSLGFAAGGGLRAPVTGTAGEVAVLSAAAAATVRIGALPDATRVTLAAAGAGSGAASGPAAGTLLFSPSTGELVMMASGLAPAPAGMEYACWVETGGVRRRIGRMYPGGGMQAWAGPVGGLASLAPGTLFGVSLAPAGGGRGDPVLTGSL